MVDQVIQPRGEREEAAREQSLVDLNNPEFCLILNDFVKSMDDLVNYHDHQKNLIQSYRDNIEQTLNLSLRDTNNFLREDNREVQSNFEILVDEAQLREVHARPPNWIPADAPQNQPGPERYEFTPNQKKLYTFPVSILRATCEHASLLGKASRRHKKMNSLVDQGIDKSAQHEENLSAGSLVRRRKRKELFRQARRIPPRVPVADAAVGSTADSTSSPEDEPRRGRRTRRPIEY